jgi:transcriptional regulator with XRE-family HTH domain
MAKILKAIKSPTPEKILTSKLLGKYVRAKRSQLGLTIEEAAAFCCVAKNTLMNLEHGHTKLQLGSMLQICQGLGIQLKVVSWEHESEEDVWV